MRTSSYFTTWNSTNTQCETEKFIPQNENSDTTNRDNLKGHKIVKFWLGSKTAYIVTGGKNI